MNDINWVRPDITVDTIAFLQYSSGSTGAPKGVMVSHGNLVHNEELIQRSFGMTRESVVVGWLPLYHDMGLIGNLLQPLTLGTRCILMSPVSFLQQPVRWLEAITRYRATTSGGPNFAYDLCVRKVTDEQRANLDLSTWTTAFVGAEPVRPDTLDRFARTFAACGFERRSFYPCYGLAEATLMVSGGDPAEPPVFETLDADQLEQHRVSPLESASPADAAARELVSCGRNDHGQRVSGQELRIVDPETARPCPPDRIGEIWVAGPSVAAGYWQREEATARDFHARLAGEDQPSRRFLRTGDLGFMRDGELFVTGRLKDLIILRGRNHYPQDLELTAEQSHPDLRQGCCAAFAAEVDGEERVIVVQELTRRPTAEPEAIADAIRQAIAEEHSVQAWQVVLIRTATIPKTSSGKIQRRACRTAWQRDQLKVVGSSNLAGESTGTHAAAEGPTALDEDLAKRRLELNRSLTRHFAEASGLTIERVNPELPLTRQGLDSLTAIELQHAVATEVGVEPELSDLLEGASIEELAAQLAGGSNVCAPTLRPAVEDRSEYPLSHGQRALWLLHRLAPSSSAYHLCGAARISGELDVAALRRALTALVARHPALRTAVHELDGEPMARIDPQPIFDWIDESVEDEALPSKLQALADRPFELDTGPLLRVGVLRPQTTTPVLVWVVHHLVADLTSIALLLGELDALYRDSAAALPAIGPSYGDFVAWQTQRFSDGSDSSLAFWREALAGLPPVLDLPTDRSPGPSSDERGDSVQIALPKETAAGLSALAASQGATQFATVLTAFQVMLARWTGQRDLAVGSPASVRTAGLQRLVGYLVNPIALRSGLDEDPSFVDALAQSEQRVRAALDHREIPFPLLVERLGLVASSGQTPVFQVMFVWQQDRGQDRSGLAGLAAGAAVDDATRSRLELGGLHLTPIALQPSDAQFPITLSLAPRAEGLAGSWSFRRDCFDTTTLQRLSRSFETLAATLVANPRAPISGLELLSTAERHQLLVEPLDVQDRPCDLEGNDRLDARFVAQAASTPDAVAVIWQGQRVSYGHLAGHVELLADTLRKQGLEPSQRVGVLLDRRPELLVAILAVLRAGGAYVPLDPAYPQQRLIFMLEDSGAGILVTRETILEGLPELGCDAVLLIDYPLPALDASSPRSKRALSSRHLAYLIYTSGSTGRPKGVAISHGSAVALLDWAKDAFSTGELTGTLAATSICFDLSVFELFLPLTTGGAVILADNMLELSSLPDRDATTLINTVPSALAELTGLGELPASVQTVNLAGEPLRRSLVEAIFDASRAERVLNLYGPSEDTTYSTWVAIPHNAEATEPTIGRAVDGTAAYVLDGRLSPKPFGSIGQLMLAGRGLARGYLGRPRRTAALFLPNPFAASAGERLYATGDRVRQAQDGELVFLGRADHQVKLRGFRIELGEIEAALLSRGGVEQAVVVLRPDDTTGDHRLVAYVTSERSSVETAELRTALAEALPAHMVPAAIVGLDDLPLLPNGKVDRKRLPAPDFSIRQAASAPPRTPTEDLLCNLFREVLAVDSVGIHDSFFALGGHSLLATRLASRVQERVGIEIELRALFERPTVADLARRIEVERAAGRTSALEPLTTVPRDRPLPLSAAQRRLWLLEQLQPGQPTYHLAGALRLDADSEACLDFTALASSLSEIERRHEALRTTVSDGHGEPRQVIQPGRSRLPRIDLQALEPSGKAAEAQRLRVSEARRPFNLERGPLMRTTLIELGEVAGEGTERCVRCELMVTLHHLVADGESLAVLQRELSTLYSTLSRGSVAADGHAPELPALPVQFADFAAWQLQQLADASESQRTAWQQRLADVPRLELPYDRRPLEPSLGGDQIAVELDAESVYGLARSTGSTPFAVLLSTFGTLLGRLSGQRDVVIGSPFANRRRRELEDLIGFFVNTLPLRLSLTDEATAGWPSFRRLVQQATATLLDTDAEQDVPLESLEAQQQERDTNATPLFQAVFGLQPARPTPSLEGLSTRLLEQPTGTAKFELTLLLTAEREAIRGTLEYRRDLFDRSTVLRWSRHLQRLLQAAAEAPERLVSELPLLTVSEQHQLTLEWNPPASDFPRDASLPALFDRQAARTPDALALIFGRLTVTYGGLQQQANRLAHLLQARGVRAGGRVGLAIERSVDLVVAMLATLKAGAAYVPLDAAYPPDRLQFMMADSGIQVILSSGPIEPLADGLTTLELDAERATLARQPATPPALAATGASLAYVIYTSGSTGRPKGAAVPQRAISRLILETNYLTLDALDRMGQAANASFDAITFEVWCPLLTGAAIVGIPPHEVLEPLALAKRLQRQRVTTLFLTTSLFNQTVRQAPEAFIGVRTLLSGGEANDPAVVRELLAGSPPERLLNGYGPTETTTFACWHHFTDVAPDATLLPIGRPLGHTQLYVVDAGLRLAAPGSAGELAIGGDGLAWGYLGRPARTAVSFVPNPLGHSLDGADTGSRLYRTGDRVRQLADGTIEFIGRIDHQVKIRGFRIEPGEVEAALADHPEVCQALALVRPTPSGDPTLVAYVVLEANGTDADADARIAEIRSSLERKLPRYLLPSALIELDALPLTPNGKLDHDALPRTAETAEPPSAAPRSALERTLAEIWRDVLGVDRIGVHDNFFDAGGHSLLMARMLTRLREEVCAELTLTDLFQYPTIAALANFIEGQGGVSDAPSAATSVARTRRPERDVAILAMTGRFPGAPDVDALWTNLQQGVESIRTFSDEELLAAGVDASELASPDYVRAWGALDDADRFDAAFFDLSPREATELDPQQRLFLECATQALERAGYGSPHNRPRVGVFAGASFSTYLLRQLSQRRGRSLVESLQALIANDKDFLASRVSYKLDLEGPSVAVQTACSTSLVAVHMACQSLFEGDCDLALAGGVAVRVPLASGYLYQEQGILSPDGHCRAFDASARGTVPGNGAGVVVLKPLAEALADGDPIQAVIKGSAINNDGSDKVSYTAPSVTGQATVIREACEAAGVEPSTISYVETHGTGTPMGDPIELAALRQAYDGCDPGVCGLGSVKTNLGHLDAAAGVTGLIKTVLALQHRQLPPSLHFEAANPELGLEASPFYINHQLKDWQPAANGNGSRPRRAGVSSFGIGGTNAHVILEEAPEQPPAPTLQATSEGISAPVIAPPAAPSHLLLLSARSAPALERAAADLASHLRHQPGLRLADIAHTLRVGRQPFEHRRSLVCSELDEAVSGLEDGAGSAGVVEASPAIAFLFPGQGAQAVGMGHELTRHLPTFRHHLDDAAQRLEPELGCDLRQILYPSNGERNSARRQLRRTEITQPALFTVEYALAKAWSELVGPPRAMIGHSLGELVAATLAGVFSLPDALALVAYRGRLMAELPAGAMLSVRLGEDEVRPYLTGDIELAAINAASQTVVSGAPEAIQRLAERLAAKGIKCRRLETSHAFHSAMMEPILEPFGERLQSLELNAPRIPFVSNVSGDWIRPEEATSPDYWLRHVRQPVRFADGLDRLLADPAVVGIEVGPDRVLSTLLRQRARGRVVVQSLPAHGNSESSHWLDAVGRLWSVGCDIGDPTLTSDETPPRRRVALPTYPFERRRFWLEEGSEPTALSGVSGHRQPLEDWFYLPSWRRSGPPGTGSAGDRRWLVLVDRLGFGERLAARLAERSTSDVPPILVRAGSHFEQRDGSRFMLRPRSRDDFERLFQTLAAENRLPNAVVHLWTLDPTAPEARGDRSFDRQQELGFDSLLALAPALPVTAEATHLTVVSNAVHSLHGEANDPVRATLLGPSRVIPQEFPSIRCRHVDVELPSTGRDAVRLPKAVLRQLTAELTASRDEPSSVAYRQGRRWREAYEPIRVAGADGPPSVLREGGVYLIVGGLGELGLLLAEYLTRACRARLVLVGRSEFPARDAWQTWLETHSPDHTVSRRIARLQACEAAGAELLITRADVADDAAMRQLLRQVDERFEPPHGIIHAAGLVGEQGARAIAETDEALRDAHFQAKIHGLRRLTEVLRDAAPEPLDFCLLFSSLAAVLGGLGLAAYAAANAFLGAFARRQRALGDSTQWLCIDWDAWQTRSEGDPDPGQHPAAITHDEADDAFDRVFRLVDEERVAVSTTELDQRLERWVERPAASEPEPEASSQHPRPQLTSPFKAPRTQLEREVADLVGTLIGLSEVGIHDDFFELGGDSLLAVELASRLRDRGSGEVPMKRFFRQPTVATLANALRESSGDETLRAEPPEIATHGVAKHDVAMQTEGGPPAETSIAQIPRRPVAGTAPLSFSQQRLWLLHQLDPNSAAYHLPVVLQLRGDLDLGALQTALLAIVDRHQALRTTFPATEGQPVQRIHDALPPELSVVDLRHTASPSDQLDELLCRPFDLCSGPLLRATLLQLSGEEVVLAIVMHHIVSDGRSMEVLVSELAAAYAASQGEREAMTRLPELPIQYPDFAHWQRRSLSGDALDQQMSFWRQQLTDAPALELPTDRPRPAQRTARGATLTAALDPGVT
ncbi:MAG: amino acid adenylation domain-containing protein, partial [Acidobacteriota bacterium]